MTYKPWLKRLAVACWVGAVVLGGIVQLGWHAHLDWLLQVQPAYAPMKYNVALCFLLYGIGQLLQAAGYLRLARAAGAVIVMIAGLTLVEYILNADLGIDELFADAYLTVQTFHPGRMSTVTAVAFLLGGGALLVQTWRTVSFRIPVVVLLNALVVAIGASIVLAYSSDAMWRDPLGAFGRMAPNTAAALILISLATLVWLWAEESVSKLSRVRWSAVLAGFTIAVAALLLWQALVARNANEIRAETRYAAESLGALLASDLEGRVEALSRMARRWAVRNGVPRDEWEADAAVHIEDFVGFQAIEWVDPALQARWIVPREADTALLDADIALHSPSRKALQAAGDSRRVTVSPVIDLEPAVKGFRVHVPIFQGNRFDGFMVGVLRVPDILQAMRSRSGTSRYSLAISDAGGEIYRSSDGNRVSSGGYAQEVRLAAAGVSWRLLVEPEPSLVAQATSALPEVVLAAGLILSLLLTITLHTISLASLRADALARSNRDLQAEVQARAKADTALRETTTFLDSALDNMPMIFWVKDAETLAYLRFNRAGEQLLGTAKEQIIGKTDAEVFPTEAHAYAAKDREVLAGREVVEIAQEPMSTQDKRVRIMRTKKLPVFDEHGKPQYIIGIAEDITEAARMHQALADSEESHRLIAETSGDMIVRITPAGVLTYVSPASVAVLGYKPEELMDRAVPEFIHPDDREEALRAYGEVVQRNVIRVVTCRLLMHNGRWVWTETSFRAVRDRFADRTKYVIGVCRNIDERVQVADALREANEDLAEYQAVEEEEKRVAKHLLDQLVRVDRTLADRVSSWILPASYFSGDVIAVAETPGRVLHLLLADGTGHGLSAALGALPAVQPFHAMTQKGSSIATIVREMNSKMRELLPTGRFIAATVASINPRSGVIQVWNGGNPACFLVGDDGEVLRRFASTHLALGVVGDHEFDARVETIALDCDCQLVIVSDGLVDAQNGNGEAFGEDRVLRWCTDAPPGARLVSLRSAIHGHLDYKPPDDDISILLARYRVPADMVASSPAMPRAAIAGVTAVDVQAGHRLELALGVDQLSASEVVPALFMLFTELRLVSRNDSAVFVVLNELFNNAVDHGLLRLESRSAGQDAERYVAERASRLAELKAGSLQIAAERIVVGDRPALRLVVRDTGDGFDHASLLRPAAGADGTRRAGGITIVRELCSALEYRDGGREVEAVVPLTL